MRGTDSLTSLLATLTLLLGSALGGCEQPKQQAQTSVAEGTGRYGAPNAGAVAGAAGAGPASAFLFAAFMRERGSRERT